MSIANCDVKLFPVFKGVLSGQPWTPLEEVVNNAQNQAAAKPQPSLVGMIKEYLSTLRIKSFRKHLMIYLLSFTGKDTLNLIFTYFCIFCLGVSAAVSANLLSMSIVGIAVTAGAGFLMVRFGPKFLFVVSYSVVLVMLVTYFVIYKVHPEHLLLALVVVSLIYQIGASILGYTPWAIFPFIPDLDELVTSQHRSGIFAAVMSFSRKASMALDIMCVGFVLELSGFVEGATSQSESARNMIADILLFGSGGLIVLAFMTALNFKLNRQTHTVVVKEIARLRQGGSKANVSPEVKQVVEQLTGVKYEDMWSKTPITTPHTLDRPVLKP